MSTPTIGNRQIVDGNGRPLPFFVTGWNNLIGEGGPDPINAILQVAGIYTGTGTPEGVVTASVGALYRRTDGGASTTLYVKESGAGSNTGWVAK